MREKKGIIVAIAPVFAGRSKKTVDLQDAVASMQEEVEGIQADFYESEQYGFCSVLLTLGVHKVEIEEKVEEKKPKPKFKKKPTAGVDISGIQQETDLEE